MDKWYGNIGFADTIETEPGNWEEKIVEYQYYGDVISDRWKRQTTGEKTNDDINIANQISILADPYAMNHCSKMAYVEFMGARWKVSDIEVQYPRLIINIGSVWNGDSTGTAS